MFKGVSEIKKNFIVVRKLMNQELRDFRGFKLASK